MWTLHLCPKCIKMNTCNLKTLCFHSQTHSNVLENKGLSILSYARLWKHNGFLGFLYILASRKGVLIYPKGSFKDRKVVHLYIFRIHNISQNYYYVMYWVYILSGVYHIWIYIYIYHIQYNVTDVSESTTFHVGVYNIIILYTVLSMCIIDEVYNTVGIIYM